jgi:glycosyltransferase involved in cell wall biosynthesis
MQVTVVIPSYNCGPLTVEAVESVLAQTVPASEILVVIDGSTDNTFELLNQFGDRIRLITQPNQGVAAARNTGLRLATGEFVAFLDADDVWHPEKLERQLSFLNLNPEIGVLATLTYAWPSSEHPNQPLTTVPGLRCFSEEELLIRNPLTTSSVIIRRSLQQDLGDFDIRQFGTEDYDLWLRAIRSAKIARLEMPLTGYRTATPGSLSKNAARMEAGMRIIQGKLDEAKVFQGRGPLRRKMKAYHRYTWAYMHYQAGNFRIALWHILVSLLNYPFSYSREEVRYRAGRIKLGIAAFTCMIGMKSAR